MIQRKLSNAHGHTVATLAQQQAQLQQQMAEAQEAINALAELLRAHYDLAPGPASFTLGADGAWRIVVYPAPALEPDARQEADDAEPAT